MSQLIGGFELKIDRVRGREYSGGAVNQMGFGIRAPGRQRKGEFATQIGLIARNNIGDFHLADPIGIQNVHAVILGTLTG